MMKDLRARVWRAVLVLALLMLPVMSASAFVDPPSFSPVQPYAGQSVDMSVRAGGCHGFAVPPPGYPYVEVQTNGNVVDVIIAGVEAYDPILCIFGVGTITVDIGEFPQGDYMVRVRIRQINPPFDVLPPASNAGLVVLGQPAPVIVPATSVMALATAAGFIIMLAIVAFKRPSGFLAVVLFSAFLASPRVATAQDTSSYIFVEISSEDGTPTPEQVVDDFDVGSGLPPPVSALAVENPNLLEYLIPRDYRAQGDFKNYLESNPNLPRARLEQTIIVGYPDGADLDTALAALLADPYVRHANIPEAMELSTPIVGQTDKKGSGSNEPAMAKGSATQYWINAMNFTGAWARAGGWSRVGVIDNGLYTNHSDLRSQNASGALTGGNFLPSAAVDLGRHGIPNGSIDFNVDEMEPIAIAHPAEVACDPLGTGSILVSTSKCNTPDRLGCWDGKTV